MAVTINPPDQIDQYSWEITWESSLGDPTYYIYINGKLFEITDNESMIVTAAMGEPDENISIDIFDSEDDSPDRCYPGKLTINWEGSDDVDYYSIKKCVAEEWIEQARIYDHGEKHFSWLSDFLDDVTVHTFQIVPIGTNGNTGTEAQLTCLMVRYPDIPDKSFSYSDDTHKITIS